MLSLRLAVELLILPITVYSLTCHVCGTGGLDEFGECKGQFQYDCTPYGSKFDNERIYCRTTREKQRNGTYTVKKECISETDHYSEFPNKGYSVDDECDLVDIKGEEVAYCLCRTSLCNDAAMAEQFMAFEEKHPELFGEMEASREAATIEKHSKKILAPVAAFAAPSLTPQAIVPVNDPRFSIPFSPSLSSENKRTQLPSRSNDGIMSEIGRQIALPTRDDSGMIMLQNIGPVSHSGFVGTVGASHPSSNLPRPPATPPTAAGRKTQTRTNPIPVPANALHCMQCGDSSLSAESSDCIHSVSVECSAEDSLCFTRMIVMAQGSHKVEKMCVSPEAVSAMFGDEVVGEECGTASQGKEKFCTCSTSNCNNLSLAEQIILHSPPPPEPLSEVPTRLAETAPAAATEVRRPTMEEPEEAIEERMPLPPTSLGDLGNLMTSKSEEEKPTLEEKLPIMKPIIPVVVSKQQPPNKPSLRCSSCLQSDLSDPTADCAVSSPLECSQMANGQAFCMTKQTQEGHVFSIEKRCVSLTDFISILPSESFSSGCAVAKDGLINYCLCDKDMCNRESLLEQAQSNGVREPIEAVKKMMIHEKPMLPVPPPITVKTFEEERNRVELPNKIMSNEDQQLIDRRKEWAGADLNSSAHLSISSSIIMVIYLLF